jgi:hypothetical protein
MSGPPLEAARGDVIEQRMLDRRRRARVQLYRSTGRMWMFAGNSRDALQPQSRGKGPFESHRSGALLTKELKEPWNRTLKRYYDAVQEKLKRQAGFDAYFQLAEERRRRFTQSMPIAQEFPLLLPRTSLLLMWQRAASP